MDMNGVPQFHCARLKHGGRTLTPVEAIEDAR